MTDKCFDMPTDMELLKVKDELNKYKDFVSKARKESKLCAIDGQHFVLVPYWFMLDILRQSDEQ